VGGADPVGEESRNKTYNFMLGGCAVPENKIIFHSLISVFSRHWILKRVVCCVARLVTLSLAPGMPEVQKHSLKCKFNAGPEREAADQPSHYR